jgi:hypothetical protein
MMPQEALTLLNTYIFSHLVIQTLEIDDEAQQSSKPWIPIFEFSKSGMTVALTESYNH